MAGKTPPQVSIPLPTLSNTKEREFDPTSEPITTNTTDHSVPHAQDLSDSDTAATNSSDEFDWDEDEDTKNAHLQEQFNAKRGRAVWLAFMKLARPVRSLLVGILGVGILITPLLVVEFKFKSDPVRLQVHVWSFWLSIVWATSCMTYLLVETFPRMVISLIVLFGGHAERRKTQLELTLAVSFWLKLALDISWAWLSLYIIREIYQPGQFYWTIVNRVMEALFAAGIILLAEKLFLHFVAINFHQKALADRLAENRLGLKALDRLSNAHPTPSKKPAYSRRGQKDDLGGADGSPLQEKGEHQTQSEQSKRHVRREERRRRRHNAMASIIVDQVGGAIGQVALKNSKFNREGEIGSLHSARILAKKLFSALSDVTPARSHLVVEDFYPYFHTTAEAHDAFALFDKDSNGDISKKEMREAVQRIYRERKALIASLKDVGSAVAKLDAVLLAIALVGITFVCLLIFNRQNTLASLVPLATIILGFSFIFGHSAQTLFESLIFIFSTHVFDVGDLVMIDDQPLLVREFGLFSTTFRRVDGQEIIAPNALLASSKLVHNLRRSNSMWETTNLMISYNTSLEVIERLRSRINAYVAANSREWSSCALNIDKMEYQNAIHLIVAMEHRSNWQDWGGRWARRTAFMRNLKTVLEELDVRYTMPVQPVLLPQNTALNTPRMQPPPLTASRELLGNAGSFQASQHFRAPGPTFRS